MLVEADVRGGGIRDKPKERLRRRLLHPTPRILPPRFRPSRPLEEPGIGYCGCCFLSKNLTCIRMSEVINYSE